MTPTLGRIVRYRLTADEAEAINKSRGSAERQTDRNEAYRAAGMIPTFHRGIHLHVGNPVNEGEAVPMIITAVWLNEYGEGIHGVNGQAFLDGNDSLWVTSVKMGDEPGTFHWPPRV